MRISVNNIDKQLGIELSKLCEMVNIDDGPRGAFLQWVTPDETELFMSQTSIIEKCTTNKIPMIIFDTEQKISSDEVSYLLSNGAFLWEPAVADRPFFSYQPFWGVIKDFTELKLHDEERKINLGYTGSLVQKVSTFQNYFLPVYEIGDFNVFYANNNTNGNILDKINKMGIPIISDDSIGISDINMTILLGSDYDYQAGKLDVNLFTYLENGVVPLLPYEHRWFHAIFDDLVVKREEDIEYFLRTYNKIAFGSIHDIYRNLDIYLPECNVKNVAKRIIKYFS